MNAESNIHPGFILVLIILIPTAVAGWIGYSRLKAQLDGRDPPPLSFYIPWKRNNRYTDAYPAPSGIVAWVKSKVPGSASRSGAYEQPLGSSGGRRGLDPDEAWDARVGAEADGYGVGGYYEEQELGLRPPASEAYAGGGYGGGNSPALPDYGEERGRSISRAGGPHIGGGQKGLDERYDEEVGHEDPFGDEAERSELRGVSPRPHEEGKGRAGGGGGGGAAAAGDGAHDENSPTERRSMFHEDV